MIVVSALGVAVSIVKMQRQTKTVQDMEDNARAIFEMMNREIRTGTNFKPDSDVRNYICFDAAGTSATPDPYFVRYYLDSGKIYRGTDTILNSSCPSFNGCGNCSFSSINSDDVYINTLQFIRGLSIQGMITIFMQMRDQNSVVNPVNLQTTVSSRQY